MKTGTICFPLRGSRVLLGMKKRGFGEGKWNGFGGKLKDGETPLQAAVREINEESALIVQPKDLEEVAFITFFEDGEPIFQNTIFLLRDWQGMERESEEMRPQWFELKQVPYDQMWAADREWLSLALAGKKFNGTVYFKKGMNEFEKFEYTERI